MAARTPKSARCEPSEFARTWYQAESAAAEGEMVAAQQQQLRRDRPADGAGLFRANNKAVPAQLLFEGQALHREGAHGGSRRLTCFRRTIRGPARRRICCGCCRSRAAKFRAPARAFTVMMPRKKARASAVGRGARRRRRGRRRRRTSRKRKPKPEPRTFPGGKLRPAHGSAVQPHRRYAARLPILGAQRSAEGHLRRHRLDLRRTGQRAGGARDRRQGAGCRR